MFGLLPHCTFAVWSAVHSAVTAVLPNGAPRLMILRLLYKQLNMVKQSLRNSLKPLASLSDALLGDCTSSSGRGSSSQ